MNNNLYKDAYFELVEKVREIDPDAAYYMISEAPFLDGFIYVGSLTCTFSWDSTTQGHAYWGRINAEVDKK